VSTTVLACAPVEPQPEQSSSAGETSDDGSGDDASSSAAGSDGPITDATTAASSDDGTTDETGNVDTGGSPWPDGLPIDCTAQPDAPECARPIWIEAGTVGSGPPFDNYGFPQLGGGFLDAANDRIVITARFGSDSVSPTGVVATVDLHTGDRVFVSGSFMGPQGLEEFGDGAPIDYYHDVKAGSDGWYAVGERVTPETRTSVVVRIDPSNGHRELVWDFTEHPCNDAVGTPIIPGGDAIALAPDGRAMLVLEQNPLGAGYGIVAVSDSGCEVISRSAGDGADIGGGAPLTGAFYGMDSRDDLVWGVEWLSASLMSIDPTTGGRVRVSNAGEFAVGRGPELGNEAVAHAGDVIYTYAGVLTEVDPATGNRNAVPMINGPLLFAQTDGKVIPHPNSDWVIVLSEIAVVVLDKTTGNNNLLSY
jgi:hypothetical protein